MIYHGGMKDKQDWFRFDDPARCSRNFNQYDIYWSGFYIAVIEFCRQILNNVNTEVFVELGIISEMFKFNFLCKWNRHDDKAPTQPTVNKRSCNPDTVMTSSLYIWRCRRQIMKEVRTLCTSCRFRSL